MMTPERNDGGEPGGGRAGGAHVEPWVLAWVLLLLIASCSVDPPICTQWEVQVCHCAGGQTGARQCDDGGRAWSECTCGSTLLVTCGNGRCGPGESATNCPTDCGCGNNVCDAGETTATCPSDCPVCRACTRDADCPSGMQCGRRRCDNARGCFSLTSTAPCFEIEGVTRPRRCFSQTCTEGSDDCGRDAECAALSSGGALTCVWRCGANSDCFDPRGDGNYTVCDTASGRCLLRCSQTRGCPAEMTCAENPTIGATTCH